MATKDQQQYHEEQVRVTRTETSARGMALAENRLREAKHAWGLLETLTRAINTGMIEADCYQDANGITIWFTRTFGTNKNPLRQDKRERQVSLYISTIKEDDNDSASTAG